METFTTLRSIVAPMLRNNIDTDVIIRIEHLGGSIPRDELGSFCFESWRYLPDRSENPDFLLNRDPYRRARILMAGSNFGCGSSREGAVWALMGMGFRAVIAPSFGDIFFNNCFQNGMLPVQLERSKIDAITSQVEADPEKNQVTIDLVANQVLAPDGTQSEFHIPALRRESLLHGLDDVGLTLKRASMIDTFQAADRARRPWIYDV